MQKKNRQFRFLHIGLMAALIASLGFYAEVADALSQKGLIIYYSFDQDTVSGNAVRDLAGGNDGLIKGSDIKVAAGKVKEALEFPGAETDYISVRGHFYSKKAEIADITVAAWIAAAADSTDKRGMVASWDRSEYFRFAAGDDVLSNAGAIGWDTRDENDVIHDFKGNADVVDGTWHHIAATYNSATGEKRVYVDGKLDANDNAYAAGTKIGKPTDVTRYGFIGIGSESPTFDGAIGPNWAFKGLIDEFFLFHRALNDAEIDELFKLNGLVAVEPAGKLASTWGDIKASR
jgi:hypothetical protein